MLEWHALGDSHPSAACAGVALELIRTGTHELADELEPRPRVRRNVGQARIGFVAGRFARADLFTALLQPSRDVSARYQTTVIETAEGKVYQGLVIYEAVDGVLLQTGAASTVRVAGEQIAARRVTSSSLMPAGLLEGLRDEELADLYTYLRTLGGVPGKR